MTLIFYQDFWEWLTQQCLTKTQHRVLLNLFGKLNFDSYICVSHKEIADELQLQPVNVSQAVKKLKELKIIIEGPSAGRSKTYRINSGATPTETSHIDEKIF